ncbi:MAG: alpha-galactosidase [Christensenellales bacterium]
MIEEKDLLFRLSTKQTSYWFRVTSFGHLEHIHYGPRLAEQDPQGLVLKRIGVAGGNIIYDDKDPLYCLESMCLEWSGIGRGDYRPTPAEIKMPDGSFSCDFIYRSYRIIQGAAGMQSLPNAYGRAEDCRTLELTLEDVSNKVTLLLYYTVFEQTDVITRRSVLINNNAKPLVIRRIMSMQLDMPNRGFRIVTFDGGWIKEAHKNECELKYGLFVNQSTTGASSHRHNPGFLLAEAGANEEHGYVYGFNLVYSGNHYGAVDLSNQQLVRVMLGINPYCFEWTLYSGEKFETPEAIMTFSGGGYNGASANFHDFINNHIIRGEWKNSERPVLINSWEAHFFFFNERRLLRLARRAKKTGIELFVLDDGWFGERNDDTKGLGDYTINKKKLPRGLPHLANRIRKMGLRFGLWVEPEMVNENSDLFRAHPEYAVTVPGKKPSLGRNQLVLDLCNHEVRDYIVSSVSRILDESDISYVKWDMNRHISDAYSPLLQNQGEFFHRYTLGLYDVLRRIFGARPHILLESCSSGGNRFDLGILCFSPQIWASDNTDPIARLSIQNGLSYLYPLSTISAHVSQAPHFQTLRNTPLPTRFNVACFGSLGYELNLRFLSRVEKKEVKEQISFYKAHRKTFQFGRFYRHSSIKDNKMHWQCIAKDGSESIAGFFQTRMHAGEGFDYLPLSGLEPDARYTVTTRPQSLFLGRFGYLISYILPFVLHPYGLLLHTAAQLYRMKDCVENYECGGDMLNVGIKLNNQFQGSYYNEQVRMLGDFGSNLYLIIKHNYELLHSHQLPANIYDTYVSKEGAI